MKAAAGGQLTPAARQLAAEGVMGCWLHQGRDAALLAKAEALVREGNPLPEAIEACCNAPKYAAPLHHGPEALC